MTSQGFVALTIGLFLVLFAFVLAASKRRDG
jgi:hypothetical protein